ncbi:unnamed protein product [Bursaphelenchus okinawaensis]|uniref:Uncharacterized protein n=1 Tax=Bursaphelenchus okinawaensis TaxID=465554 RepID=A0A811K1J9_9BILA|nr:unnamed protein product [Bursaphelenchus okinawaensis]CAG9089529.1 unnamed protein product [Bursaphelenchus okinawaensis]
MVLIRSNDWNLLIRGDDVLKNKVCPLEFMVKRKNFHNSKFRSSADRSIRTMRLFFSVLLITLWYDYARAQDPPMVSAEEVRDQLCSWCSSIDSNDFHEMYIVTADNGDRNGYYLRLVLDDKGWPELSTAMLRGYDEPMLLYPIATTNSEGGVWTQSVFWRNFSQLTVNKFTGEKDPAMCLGKYDLPAVTGKEFLVYDYYVYSETQALKLSDICDGKEIKPVNVEDIVSGASDAQKKDFMFHIKNVCFKRGFACASDIDNPYQLHPLFGRKNPIYYRVGVFVYARCLERRCGYYVYDEKYHVDQYVPDTINFCVSHNPQERWIRALVPRVHHLDRYFW